MATDEGLHTEHTDQVGRSGRGASNRRERNRCMGESEGGHFSFFLSVLGNCIAFNLLVGCRNDIRLVC